MIKSIILVFTLLFSLSLSSQEAIQQWVYNTLERAQLNVDNGNFEAAEKIYYDYATSSYSSNSYDHFVILRSYAYFLLQQDRNDEALKYLQLADQKRKMPPLDVFNLKFILGQVLYAEGQRQEAKASFLEWVEIGTDNQFDLRPEGYATLATIYAQESNWDNALIYITLAIENSSIFVENWAQLKFAIHIQKEQYMPALEIAQNLVRIKPKNKAYIEQMAGVYNIIRFEEESLASLEFKLQQNLLKKPSEYINLANFYLYKGLPIDSSKVIKNGLSLGVLDNNIKNNELLSNAYIIAKDFDNAVNSLINVTKLSDDPKYDYRIGQIYLQNSDYKNAIKFLKIARKKNWNGSKGSLEMLIGISYIELDDFNNARIELARAIALGKEDEAESWIDYMDSTDSLRAAAN
ncbi:tetratricopeptide repeat protein [Gammaproteobacteria bacterium]|nr:tetratricopeptide repeat protein [Gammaproteobacteria bacterium]MDA9248279.1 tetratricopeptide repeat protein [Gammaproteobacteria bacterium]